jgi:hypothetical protein
MKSVLDKGFLENVRQLLREAQASVVREVNHAMLRTYFELGRRIVEEEQKGVEQATYGTYLMKALSEKLTEEFGKGYSRRNLELMRRFYTIYRFAKSPISQSLSWTHYMLLMRIESEGERRFYEIEAEAGRWSVRELDRQINAALYQRLAVSKDKEKVKELAEQGHQIEKPIDAVKDRYIKYIFSFKKPDYLWMVQ